MDNYSLKDYELHTVAGTFLLVNMQQSGEKYIKPIEINEVGADIFTLLKDGKNETDIAESIRKEYGIDFEEALRDVRTFIRSLNETIK